MNEQGARRLTDLLEKIAGHPIVRAVEAEESARILAERERAAARIAIARKTADITVPGFEAELANVQDELAAYDEGRKAILDRLTDARIALAKERQATDYEIAQGEAVLFSTYAVCIDEAIQSFRDTFYSLSSKKTDTQQRIGERFINETEEITTFSNRPAIEKAMNYCRAAIAELEVMKLVPAVDLERIEELKKGLPDHEELSEFSGIQRVARHIWHDNHSDIAGLLRRRR